MDIIRTEITLLQIIIFAIVCMSIVFIYSFYFTTNNATAEDNVKESSKINVIADFIEKNKNDDFTIIDCLKHVAKEYPRKTALKIKDGKIGNKIKWKSVDYITYYKNSVGFAQSLNYWLGTYVNVAIIGFNSPGWFYSHLGCMLNGGIPTGLHPNSNKETCKQILNNCKAKVLVVDDDTQLQKFIGMNLPTIQLIIYYSPISEKMVDKFYVPVVSMGNFMSEKNSSKLPKIKLSSTATLIYTSGTTGIPKGVIVTHKNIMTSIKRILSLIKLKSSIECLSQENFLSYLPLNHITAQFMDIYLPIVTLGKVWFADKNALKTTLVDTLKEVRPTCFTGVPRIWEKIQENINEKINKEGIKGQITLNLMPKTILEKIGLDKCKYALSAGAPLLLSTITFFKKIGLEVNDNYGLSETCGPISVNLPNFSKHGSVGFPIMGVTIGPDGEILVKGDNLFSGYFDNEQENKIAFTKEGWFKTGDIGMLDSDGFLYVTGRKKDIIVTAGGENISPNPIENKLSEYLKNYFDDIVVVGDKLKFLSVLLASPKKLPSDINKIIESALNSTNKLAPSSASTIKKYLIINDKFIVGNELTNTMKIKRDFVQKKYNSKISKLYE